jgi:hypothetical protein
MLGIGITAIALVSNGNSDFGTTGSIAVLGGACVLGSIPFLLASGRNKRRARAFDVSLNIEKLRTQPFRGNAIGMPSVGLHMRL